MLGWDQLLLHWLKMIYLSQKYIIIDARGYVGSSDDLVHSIMPKPVDSTLPW